MDTLHNESHAVPAWKPSSQIIINANISKIMQQLSIDSVPSFHQWTIKNFNAFWQLVTDELNIQFKTPARAICQLNPDEEFPIWYPGAEMNITDSCFNANDASTAIIYLDENDQLCHLTYGELNKLSNQVANGLLSHGFIQGDAIAVAMPMNHFAVAIYLGIIKMGGMVVAIADSFSSQEIATRLEIAKTKGIFTQDFILRAGKKHDLYSRVIEAKAPKAILLSFSGTQTSIRKNDYLWQDFLSNNTVFSSVPCQPMSPCNILFSSGTTAAPKAIPWNHTTPIRAAMDAFFHQNIKPDDVLCWPTNLGWMMGPWIIFAAFINKACLALYTDIPTNQAFGKFVEKAGVTILGVVPTLVASWKQSGCMEKLDWQKIKIFTSTGECSNPDDMRYLMSLAGNKPVIEYCGGTEIGGAYVSSTVVEENTPSQFTTATMGMNFEILNEEGHQDNLGEVAIIPPSIGLSTELLNANHHDVYFKEMPTSSSTGKKLRRHGDQIQRLNNGNFLVLGRVDDAMNLGGIKLSSAEIERALVGIDGIQETAAIAVSPPGNGPAHLVIFAASPVFPDKKTTLEAMQKRINQKINPLFKIHDLVFVKNLPKTASNKIMRRVLRKEYIGRQS